MRANKGRPAKQAVSIILLVATLSLRLLPPQTVEFPRAFMMDVVAAPAAPLHYAASGVRAVLGLIGSGGSSGDDLEKQVVELSAELARTQAQLARAEQALASYGEFKYVAGRAPIFAWNASLNGYVVGGDTDVFSRSYVVGVGQSDGVAVGSPVVWGRVALGVVGEVGVFHSRVRILADSRSRICVRFARSGYEGVLAGTGAKACYVRFVPNRVGEGEISPGDLVVTSGADEIFPPDLAVGRVTRFYLRPAEPDAYVEVELIADYSRLQNCLVLKRSAGPGGQ